MRFQRGLILLVVSFAARAQVPDPVIESARKAAAAYATSLPDYIVKRSTTRLSARVPIIIFLAEYPDLADTR